MKLVEGLLRQWQHHTCSHQWVRARWEDGSYGLRCARCMTAYPHTWDEVIGSGVGLGPALEGTPARVIEIRRAA